MSNLARKPALATCKRPKMSHFKMGLQGKPREAKRLNSILDQQILDTSGKIKKFLTVTIDRVYTHSDGVLTGNIRVQGKVFHCKRDVLRTIQTIKKGKESVEYIYSQFWTFDYSNPLEV